MVVFVVLPVSCGWIPNLEERVSNQNCVSVCGYPRAFIISVIVVIFTFCVSD